MIVITLVFIFFLIWNIFNETLFLKYNGIKSKIFQRDWHLYDAIFRVVLFATIIINEYGITYLSGKLLLALFLLYHISFDIGFNIKRNIDNKIKLTFINIFHIGGGSIDATTKKVIDFILWKVVPKKYDEFKIKEIRKIEAFASLIIKLIELILIWIILSSN